MGGEPQVTVDAGPQATPAVAPGSRPATQETVSDKHALVVRQPPRAWVGDGGVVPPDDFGLLLDDP